MEYLQTIYQQLKATVDSGLSIEREAITSALFGDILKFYSQYQDTIPESVKPQLGDIKDWRRSHFLSLCRNLESVASRRSNSLSRPDMHQRFVLLLQNMTSYSDLLIVDKDLGPGALWNKFSVMVLTYEVIDRMARIFAAIRKDTTLTLLHLAEFDIIDQFLVDMCRRTQSRCSGYEIYPEILDSERNRLRYGKRLLMSVTVSFSGLMHYRRIRN